VKSDNCVDLCRGMRLAKHDFGSVLQKTAVFWFSFSFTELTAVAVFQLGFCTVY